MAEIVKRARHDGYLNKVKRNKHESLKLAVGSYLARRHYSENEIRRKAISCEEMMVTQLIEKEISKPNSILFGTSSYRNSICNDPNPILVETYFYKLVQWINGLTAEDIKKDLIELITPLFCHLYVELLASNNIQQTANIFKFIQEQKNLTENDNCGQVLKELPLPDAKSRPIVKLFRSNKYHITLSIEAINLLKSYLSKHGHMLIIQVLQTWFDIEINRDTNGEKSDEIEPDVMPTCNGDVPLQDIDEDLLEIQQVIKAVDKLPPSLLLINLFNSQDLATCGYASCHDERVVLGYSTSEIRIWGFGNTLLPCTTVTNNAAKITLACDNAERSENIVESNLTCSGAVILRGHGASIHDVKIVSEADVLLSVSQDCSMRAWRLADHSCAAVYRGHNYPIWCLDTSSLGLYTATGSADSSLKIWSLDRLYPVRICAGHKKDVTCVNFHPNGSYLASGSIDKCVRMWSVVDGKTVRLFVGHTDSIYSVSFSPDGQYIASSGVDNCIRIWDLTAAKQLTELVGCSGIVSRLNWSKDGAYLASSSTDGCVRLWNANTILKQGNEVEPCSVYDTGSKNLLSLRFDDKWLTCLSSTTY